MNKKGFTLMELLATIVIIGIVLMIVYPEISKISKKNNDDLYKSYENMMVEYAMVSKLNYKNTIKLAELEDLIQIKNECKGYVTINHGVSPVEYKAYIRCGEKYTTTPGYDTTKE